MKSAPEVKVDENLTRPVEESKISNAQPRSKMLLQLVAILLLLVVFGSVGFLAFRKKPAAVQSLPKTRVTRQKPKFSFPVSPAPLAKRSKAPGLVLGATTATGFNTTTGQPINAKKEFLSTDKSIVLLMSMKNPPVGTRIEYVRYLNGKYLDHNSLQVARPGWLYSYFTWLTKANKSHLAGLYQIRVYTNGILEKNFNYLVNK